MPNAALTSNELSASFFASHSPGQVSLQNHDTIDFQVHLKDSLANLLGFWTLILVLISEHIRISQMAEVNPTYQVSLSLWQPQCIYNCPIFSPPRCSASVKIKAHFATLVAFAAGEIDQGHVDAKGLHAEDCSNAMPQRKLHLADWVRPQLLVTFMSSAQLLKHSPFSSISTFKWRFFYLGRACIYHHLPLQIQGHASALRPPSMQAGCLELDCSVFRRSGSSVTWNEKKALERVSGRESKGGGVTNMNGFLSGGKRLWRSREGIEARFFFHAA